MKDDQFTITPTKNYVRDKFFLKYKGEKLSVYEHKILDFLVYKSLKMLSECRNDMRITAGEYLKFSQLNRPSYKQYERYYEAVEKLAETKLCWTESIDEKRYSESSAYVFTMCKIIRDIETNRTLEINFKINDVVLKETNWIDANIYQNLVITNALNRKYAYELYIWLLTKNIENRAQIEVQYDIMRDVLECKKNEQCKAFNRFLKNAVEEINEKAGIGISVVFSRHGIEFHNTGYVRPKKELKLLKDSGLNEYLK